MKVKDLMKDDHSERTHNSKAEGTGIGHEVSSLRIGPVVWFMIGLSAATVIVCLLMAGLFNALQQREVESEEKPSPLAGERQKLPPEPRLQLAPSSTEQLERKLPPNIKEDHPLQEMKRVRAEQDQRLNSYGWVDQKSGVVRIPIDQAKKLLLEKGLPTRK